MRYIWQHIKTIIETYTGSLPLAHFLKNYYKLHPILGSRDRKILGAMAYSYYRAAKGFTTNSVEEKILACMQACRSENLLPPALLASGLPQLDFFPDNLFQTNTAISEGITKSEWLHSMCSQPNLFIRIRKDKKKVTDILDNHNIPYTFASSTCLSLPNGAKIDALLEPDTYVVQDASSQQTGNYFQPKKNEMWYDCCSGAGGKSLLLKDLEPGVRLTVTDRRETIIYNLHQRFRLYHHHLPVANVTDVANKALLEKALGAKKFDNIICDAPCSGSGTWARTPEQLYFFDPKTLNEFSSLQKTIAINVSHYLKPGGRMLYITCSVFREENENVVAEIIKQTGLHLNRSRLINGTSIHADSMFIAEMQK